MARAVHCLFVLSCVVCIFAAWPTSGAEDSSAEPLITLTSWTDVSTMAKIRRAPIVLLVEQRNCGFCQRLKRDLFRPLANEGPMSDRAVFVTVRTDYDEPLLEKGGKEISGFEFAELFDASTTPTILFLDHNGNEIQERQIGYVAEAAYAAALRQKIEASISLRRVTP